MLHEVQVRLQVQVQIQNLGDHWLRKTKKTITFLSRINNHFVIN